MEIGKSRQDEISLDHLRYGMARNGDSLHNKMSKTGKRLDKAITLILKEFAEILVHGQSVSSQFFE